MTTPDKERCTERVQLVLTPSDAAALRRLARETGVSMAGWVRVAVRNAAREAAARAHGGSRGSRARGVRGTIRDASCDRSAEATGDGDR